MRTQVPLAIALIAGTALFVQFFIPTHTSGQFLEAMAMWARIIGGFALVVGLGSLAKSNADKIRRRSEGYPYAVVTLIGLVVMAVVGILGAPESEAHAWRPKLDAIFQWLFSHVQVPMDATIFSLLAFFIASAAYRTFRPRTFEAALLLVAALIVMLGRVPLGVTVAADIKNAMHLSFSDTWLESLVEWIMNCPSNAAQRAVGFGAALAAVAQALRIIVGIERPYMSGS